MQRIFFILVSILFSMNQIFAIQSSDIGFKGVVPDGSIMTGSGIKPVQILTLIQSVLLKVMLPVIVIGASIYIAYELFTAEGDESKMKKAWKSIVYTVVALVAIALSYGLVSIISRLSI